MKEAVLYEKIKTGEVKCSVCAHRCVIFPGTSGICRVRENRGGELYSTNYKKAAACNVDPIEKKPFFHFLPGSSAFSFGARGCNFSCSFCQNHTISKENTDSKYDATLSPDEIVLNSRKAGCESIAYTYTEPAVFMEYALDTAKKAKAENIKNLFVTNGYMTPEALELVGPFLDAADIDLKSFSDKFYRSFCGARLGPVLDNIKAMKKMGVWVEVTTLIIPGENDSPGELKDIANFIAGLGADIPWHVSRFYPAYKMAGASPTPAGTLKLAFKAGKEAGLRYVYAGNAPGEGMEDTYCYNCGEKLISRALCRTVENKLTGCECPACGAKIDGVFK